MIGFFFSRLISEGWKLLGALFAEGIDSAVSLDGKAYFIKGTQCVRYDLATQKPDYGKLSLPESHPLKKLLNPEPTPSPPGKGSLSSSSSSSSASLFSPSTGSS